jgi:hypothetical protein
VAAKTPEAEGPRQDRDQGERRGVEGEEAQRGLVLLFDPGPLLYGMSKKSEHAGYEAAGSFRVD